MAKKPNTVPLFDITFIRWQMTSEEKSIWKGLQEKSPFAHLEMVEDFVGQGYKISLSFDEKNDTYNCVCTSPKTMKLTDNAGFAYSTRGKTALEAMDMAMYKHYHLCEKQEWAIDETGDGSLG